MTSRTIETERTSTKSALTRSPTRETEAVMKSPAPTDPTAPTRVAPALLVALVAVSSVACAEPKEPLARAAAHWGQCTPCHGANGEGKREQLAPPIAGLPAWYVETQLQHYKADIRGNAYDDLAGLRMRPMALSLLKEQDIKDMAAFVETLPTPPAQVAGIDGYAPNGASAFALCVACHGANGEGNPALKAPPIAGQADWYVYEQLRKFKGGLRGADPRDVTGAQMRAIALGLGDDKALHDVARYVADLPVKRTH